MHNQPILRKILDFFLIKIIIGIAVVVGAVALMNFLVGWIIDQTSIRDEIKNVILDVVQSFAAVLAYILLFRWYEKRKISELAGQMFFKNAVVGFLIGFILQSMFILVIYLANGYTVTSVNPTSFMLPAFATGLSAGFVGEIVLRGIAFRLIEGTLGTMIALLISIIFFAIAHAGPGTTWHSIIATTILAGILLPSAYILTRSLWLPIFIHFAWDFAEPGIYGGINPGNSITQSLFTSKIVGDPLITGAQQGPQNSIQALLLCALVSVTFLLIARRKNNFIALKRFK